MSAKSKQEKKMFKSKEELKQEKERVKQIEKANKLRKEIKDKVYPTLLEASSIAEAKNICKIFMSVIQQGVNETYTKLISGNLFVNGKSLDKMFDKQDPNYKKYMVLWGAVKDKNYIDTYAMISGFENAIGAALQQEEKKRKLVELTDFDKNFE